MIVSPVSVSPLKFFEPPESGRKIAYRRYESEGASLGLLFCEGLLSDMQGVKGVSLEVESQMRLHTNCVRFDYEGQGLSSGEFDRSSLCQWIGNTVEMLDNVCTQEPQILIASSIGAWVALHAVLQRPQRIKAIILTSPAVDITEVWWRKMSTDQKHTALQTKRLPLPTDHLQEGTTLPLSFVEASRPLLLMRAGARSIPIACPVRIFHGLQDSVAPPSQSRELTEKLATDDVHITLIKDGDHRLSRPQDLSAIFSALSEMVEY